MWQGHILIFKVTLENKSMILINIYRPPANKEVTVRFIAIIDALNKKYENTPFVIFGDLNYKREELNDKFNLLFQKKFNFIYDTDPDQFTRIQETINGTQKNYLDYFIIKNISKIEFSLHEPIGNSDHRTISIKILDTSMRINRIDFKNTCFNRIWKDCLEISNNLLNAINKPDCINNLLNLIYELKGKYPPKFIKLKSHFKIIEKLNVLNDWDSIHKLIKTSNTEAYYLFLSCFEDLKATRKDKEYFMRLRFYSELNKNTDVLSDLTINDPIWGKTVTTNKEIINNEIAQKYKKLFKDNNNKIELPLLDNSVILYTDDIVLQALKKLDLSKAISWDYIPGKAFNIFKKPENINYLTNLLNQIICLDKIPNELSLGRLFCLNKNASEPGTIDSIRPIVILGVLTKLLEYPLLQELKTVKLNTSQIGFKERMSTEVNIIRLRQLIHNLKFDNYNRKIKLNKRYLLFVDLKTAFDSVDLSILINKLKLKGIPIPVINTLIKLMNSSKISSDMENIININSGVAQGKLCSPNLFNIYIDDLLTKMNSICFCSLAFADDTVFICENKEQLLIVIEELENWCKTNKIEINKKKSGILIINDDGKDPNTINNYPVVLEYKYLGVLLDTKISPANHIFSIRNKINTYFERNGWLHKKYFTPFSLIRIIDYFVKSRISYGLCCFLDNPSAMKRLEDTLVRHLKSIFDLPKNTSHRRILATLGESEIKMRLAIRLLKNWHKYKENFGEYPMFYENTLLKYFNNNELYSSNYSNIDFKMLRDNLINNNIRIFSSEFLPCRIRDNHREFLKKYIFSWPDLRNWHLLRYFTHTTKGTCERLFPICKCGAQNNPKHGANECNKILNNREDIIKKFNNLFREAGLNQQDNLYDYLHVSFFTIENNSQNKTLKKIIELMKTTISQLIINDKSIERRKVRPSNNDQNEDNIECESAPLDKTIIESDIDSD
jgi:hypothetical protein